VTVVRVKDPMSVGLAVGAGAHGLGTAAVSSLYLNIHYTVNVTDY
jgi:putative effector of murein hydrolase